MTHHENKWALMWYIRRILYPLNKKANIYKHCKPDPIDPIKASTCHGLSLLKLICTDGSTSGGSNYKKILVT